MTKFDVSTILTGQVMDCEINVIGKAIFADPVTYQSFVKVATN